MPTIAIKEQEYFYDSGAVIKFAEGLIGLPEMRRAVLIPMPEFEPFFWLASVEDEKNRFVVVDPHEIFTGYEPLVPAELAALRSVLETFAIVKISSNWERTTFNLRAPVFINTQTRQGMQIILNESRYTLAEELPQS